jgi:hypothetical protein
MDDLARRTLAWREKLNEIRGEVASLKVKLGTLADTLFEVQKDDVLSKLIRELPPEGDAVLEETSGRGAHATAQERGKKGTFGKKE